MFGWLNRAKACASFSNRPANAGSFSRSGARIFNATVRSSEPLSSPTSASVTFMLGAPDGPALTGAPFPIARPAPRAYERPRARTILTTGVHAIDALCTVGPQCLGTGWKQSMFNPSPEGLRSILQSCQDTVYNLCYQVLRHAQDAEDASQKTLLEVARALPRIQDATHLRRWVHRVSFHVALNARKKERIRMDYERRKAAQAPGSDQPSEELQALIGAK